MCQLLTQYFSLVSIVLYSSIEDIPSIEEGFDPLLTTLENNNMKKRTTPVDRESSLVYWDMRACIELKLNWTF